MYTYHDGRAQEPVGDQGDGKLAPDGAAAEDAAQQLVAHLGQHWPHHRPQPEQARRAIPFQLEWLCLTVTFACNTSYVCSKHACNYMCCDPFARFAACMHVNICVPHLR